MKLLLVDDVPQYIRPFRDRLLKDEIELTVVHDLGTAWRFLHRRAELDLIVIDIALDTYEAEFAAEQSALQDGLLQRGYGGLQMSGQALGLRLWSRRHALRFPYCYVTNHVNLWVEGLGGADPEFGDNRMAGSLPTIIDKSSLWPDNIAERLEAARSEWVIKAWIGGDT